jgi:hypothetical protein
VTTSDEMLATIARVAVVFSCKLDDVEVHFGVMRGEPWWTITVKTQPKDRRRKRDEETSGHGDTLELAAADAIRRVATHTHEGLEAETRRVWGKR